MPHPPHPGREDRGPGADGLLSAPPADRPGPKDASGLVAHYFRHEYGRLVASLTRTFGTQHLAMIEDAVQGALMSALTHWAAHGVPDAPGAWLQRAARNLALDTLRRASGRARLLTEAHPEDDAASEPAPGRFPAEVADDLLRMLFVCCDDALPEESRLVLALKTLCGFGTDEIARRLFLSEANVHKRLQRARDTLRERDIDLDSPTIDQLRTRLSAVHAVVYLLFNEGYLSAQPDRLVRRELCEEALRLGEILAEHPAGATPETFALLALMSFHAARLSTRIDAMGQLLVLEDQDRASWDRDLIARGFAWLGRAAVDGAYSRYHAEAAIAAEHCAAPSYAQTRWSEVADWYEILERIAPSPLYTMNRAVAVAELAGPDAGLALLETVVPPPWLAGFYLWDSVLGELHRRAGHHALAERHLARALEAAPTDAEKQLLERRLATVRAALG